MKIETITTPFVLGISVNCYLVEVADGFVLIDTAKTGQRRAVEAALEGAGCTPGNLKLIVLTHGDFDHCGNAAYLRQKYATRIALHGSDAGMVENGDMFASRKQLNPIMRSLMGLIFSLAAADRFKPDVLLKEDDDLAAYGLAAKVIELPGHCRGNIGLLMPDGELFCGDLLGNTGKPAVWSLVDDAATMAASVEKLKGYTITTVYPGHGKAFPITAFWEGRRAG
jgi:glyoxylase-like metal-dependent hydrolase (beta-lactamase superfamily II)